MDLQRTIANARQHIKSEGLGETFRWLSRRARWRWHERRLGIRTECVIEREALGYQDTERNEYVPTDYTDFARIMGAFHSGHLASQVFVDYGAGMGRTMVLAAGYPFKRVCGVEFSPVLASIARLNIEKAWPKLKCRDIELTVGDAAEYALPAGASILYSYNSFAGLTLEAVLGTVRRRILQQKDPLYFISNAQRDSKSRLQLNAHDDWLELRSTLQLSEGRVCDVFRAQLGRG